MDLQCDLLVHCSASNARQLIADVVAETPQFLLINEGYVSVLLAEHMDLISCAAKLTIVPTFSSRCLGLQRACRGADQAPGQA